MASVWCAHDRVLGRDVAVKLLAENFAYDQAAIRRFKREARAAARLSGHPHVVTIYDVAEAAEDSDQGRRAFIVMEYLAGGTVADALRVGPLDRREAARWLHEAAGALDFAHGRGVIHRDIKPANFLLDCNRVLHVADFGIARLGSEDTVTTTGHMLGTAAYLAPERALGHPATEASDRYGLAVVAFELLTGERPFAAEHFAAQARLHVETPPPRASRRNPQLPKAVDAVLARGMAKEPQDRWPTATAFVDTLELAMTERAGRRAVVAPAGDKGGGPPPVHFIRASSGRRAPRWLFPVAALASASLAIGLVVGKQYDSSSTRGHVASRGAPAHAAARKVQRAHKPPHATTTTAATSANTTPATTAPSTATSLESRGHQLMNAGDYSSAIPVLRQAVATADPSSLTYAYALFDLGHALRVSGDPRAAIPILYKRLQIPNQTDVVRQELQAALRAVGAQAQANPAQTNPTPQSTPSGPPAAAGPPGHDHGKHNGQLKSD